jgi:hypothetical protein
MSDVKTVKVTLMEQDVKKLSRSTTRKRRVKGGALAPADVKGSDAEFAATETIEGILPPPVVAAAPATSTTPTPSVDVRGPAWIPSATANTMPSVEKQVTPAYGPTAADVGLNVGPPMRGGGSGGGSVYSGNGTVKLSGKKNSLHTVATTPGAPRILPTKRKSGGAPAMATRKKEKLVISTPLKHAQNTGSAKTRKFRERKISITVRTGNRAAAKRIKEKVDALPIAQVRRALLRKGVLKPGSSKTPEPMMRAMLKDYMLLHNAD